MSDLVADSCVAAKWIIPEADSAHADRVVADTAAVNGRIIVLDLALVEVANALWKRVHRGLLSATQADILYGLFVGRPLHVEPVGPRVADALKLAARYGRSVYDAAFLARTVDLGLPGVTADEPLYRAVHGDYPQIQLLRLWPPPTP